MDTGTGIGSGAGNTELVVTGCGASSAAGVAAAYRSLADSSGLHDELSDWFLPSRDELLALVESNVIRLCDEERCALWSSSADDGWVDRAYVVDVSYGNRYLWSPEEMLKVAPFAVRPIRAL
jgi:hypothetical protein